MKKVPYLTKTTFVLANKCRRWLWNQFHDPRPIEISPIGSAADVNKRVRRLARQLFPGGVEVPGSFWPHTQALEHTQDLMSDERIPAIFEAAFEYDGIYVRVDILERIDASTWGIREVKSAASIRDRSVNLKENYVRNAIIQEYVINGLNKEKISSIEFIFINRKYQGSVNPIEIDKYFLREEVRKEILEIEYSPKKDIDDYQRVLNDPVVPDSIPSKSKCSSFGNGICPYWENCTSNKPDDWVEILHSPRKGQLQKLKKCGKEAISKLEIKDAGNSIQENIIRAVNARHDYVSTHLAADLNEITLPAIHLDFEYLAGIALPVFDGMLPFERIPFQYSAHRINSDGSLEHVQEFLANGDFDPRREFIEHLISFLSGNNNSIIVWNAKLAEIAVLKDLRSLFSDLEAEIDSIIEKIKDLAIIVRNNIILQKMISKDSLRGGGLFSLKNVAPAFDEKFSYNSLTEVANGRQAVEAYFQLATGDLPMGLNKEQLRESMKNYCKYDTMGTALVHKKLIELAKSQPAIGS